MASERQEPRTQVKTYVPQSQKEVWRGQAEDLNMSLSEFVRTMVQAGRRDFEVPSGGSGGLTEDEGGSPSDARDTPGVEGLETRILDVLRSGGSVPPDELVAAVTDDLEDRVYDALDDLGDENRVKFDPRTGGYTVTDDVE